MSVRFGSTLYIKILMVVFIFYALYIYIYIYIYMIEFIKSILILMTEEKYIWEMMTNSNKYCCIKWNKLSKTFLKCQWEKLR